MDWVQIWTIVGSQLGAAIVIFGTTLTMFLWSRTEARADSRQEAASREEARRETAAILLAIQKEMADFHGRLCSIEENRKKE